MGSLRAGGGVVAASALLHYRRAAGVSRVRALEEVQAEGRCALFVEAQAVVLRCWFGASSPLTEKLTIDWTYRALAGGALEPGRAPSADRVSLGPRRRAGCKPAMASIVISDPRMEDNGTFTCSVKNPPDVHHSLPQVVLTVTQRGSSSQLSSAGLLSLLVFLPSAVVVAALLVRIDLPRRSRSAQQREEVCLQDVLHEVVDEPELTEWLKRKQGWPGRCVQCLDTDDEDPY
uniref:Uncharacterized protein n=1 Tax=Sphaerodactylus townsendi TaxID=933632 RepID=A0ACB8EY43_9SAUR